MSEVLVTLFPVPAFTQPQQPSQYYSGWRNSPPNAIHVASTGALPKSMTLLTSLEGLYLCVDISTSRIESILSYLAYILGYYSFLPVYPELVALIGSRVPDYRGLFLRGVGGNSAALGILQEDEIKSHSHKIPRRMILPGEGLKHDSSLEEAGLEPYAVSGESSYTEGNETRPKNRAVRYLIRVR